MPPLPAPVPVRSSALYCQLCSPPGRLITGHWVRGRGEFGSDVRVPLVAWLELRLVGTTGASSGLGVTILLPRSSHTCTLWRALAVEPGLATQVLGLLLEKMSRDVPFKESRAFLLSSTPDRVATLPPLAVSGLWGGTPGPPSLPPAGPGGW